MFTVMGLDDDAMRVISGAVEEYGPCLQGYGRGAVSVIPNGSDGNVTSNDRFVTIDDAGDLAKVQSDLVLRLSEDFAGAVDLDVYMTVTEGNRFASSKAEISFSVVARADIPTLSILDKAPDADTTAAEDTAVRLFKAENGDAILTAALTDTDGSETLSLVVEKQVTLADGSKVDGTFVNAVTGQAMGVERVYSIDGTSTTVIEFTAAQFDNIAVLLPRITLALPMWWRAQGPLRATTTTPFQRHSQSILKRHLWPTLYQSACRHRLAVSRTRPSM